MKLQSVRGASNPLDVSDVVAVGLTTGAVGLISSVLSYVSARSQSRTTFAVGIQGAQIELAKVESERNRLEQQHREDERRERRSAYIAYLVAFGDFENFGFIDTATKEEFLAAQNNFRVSHSTLVMVASENVRAQAEKLDDLIEEVVKAAYQNPDSSGLDAWRTAYKNKVRDLTHAIQAVTSAMHEDVIARMLQPD